MKSKHIVIYLASSKHRDTNGDTWVKGQSRDYESTMTNEEFLESRLDIKFMIGYGSMTCNTISIEDVPTIEPVLAVAEPDIKPIELLVKPEAVVVPQELIVADEPEPVVTEDPESTPLVESEESEVVVVPSKPAFIYTPPNQNK